MAPGHRVLAVIWSVLFVTFVIGVVTRTAPLTVLPFFGVMAVAIYTYREVDRHAHLRYRWLYYLLVGSLLLSAAVTVVGAGMTVVIATGGEFPMLGLVALGTTNVIVGALAWRALVRPSTRAAAGAGMMAVLLEIVAMIIDVMINMHKGSYGDQEMGLAIALTAAMISIGTGALACFAALVAFEPKRVEVPEARVVDPS
jgi:hypothetical protein